MRKSSTYYFLSIAITNIAFLQCLTRFSDWLTHFWEMSAGGEALPPISVFFFNYSWWPTIFAIASFLLAGISFVTKLRSTLLNHIVIALLGLNAIFLFFTIYAQAAPFVRTTYKLIP